ncbi:MAG: putative addiction module antidote protein [Mesorhizobium sp.]|nr:addiction module antidote protein [Mesorhizobium sp.]MBL8575924.1 putative addiction module antidote protein [Mesorhizobium sp.]
MALKTTKWDTAEILDSPEMVAAYVEAVMEEGDPELIALALGNIARSKGMTEVAKKTGITREGLYKALSAEGDPKLSTFLGVLKSMGLRLSVKPLEERGSGQDDKEGGDLRHAS